MKLDYCLFASCKPGVTSIEVHLHLDGQGVFSYIKEWENCLIRLAKDLSFMQPNHFFQVEFECVNDGLGLGLWKSYRDGKLWSHEEQHIEPGEQFVNPAGYTPVAKSGEYQSIAVTKGDVTNVLSIRGIKPEFFIRLAKSFFPGCELSLV